VRRRQREVYRVFGEDEFFDGGYAGEPLEPVTIAWGDGRLRRVAGMAMLAGALGAVGGVIVLNSLPRARRVTRELREGSLAGARAGSLAGARASSSGQVLSARVPLAGASTTGSLRGSRRREAEPKRCAGRTCALTRRDVEAGRDELSPIAARPDSAVRATANAVPAAKAEPATAKAVPATAKAVPATAKAVPATATAEPASGSAPPVDEAAVGTRTEGTPTPPEFGFER
jgi:hypothetical protein